MSHHVCMCMHVCFIHVLILFLPGIFNWDFNLCACVHVCMLWIHIFARTHTYKNALYYDTMRVCKAVTALLIKLWPGFRFDHKTSPGWSWVLINFLWPSWPGLCLWPKHTLDGFNCIAKALHGHENALDSTFTFTLIYFKQTRSTQVNLSPWPLIKAQPETAEPHATKVC